MQRYLRRIYVIGFNILLTLLLLELFFIAYYWMKDGEYISVYDKLSQEKSSFDVRGDTKTGPCNKHVRILAPHPYLAFVRAPRPATCKPRTNNTGHHGPDVPFSKSSDEFRVMVLGGSVADQVYAYQRDQIKQYFEGKYPGKKVTVYNGALAGWKQPQQLLMLQFYGDVIDAALSIEGYNEVRFNEKYEFKLRFEAPFNRGYRKANDQFQNEEERAAIYLNARIFDFIQGNPVANKSKTAYFLGELLRRRVEISAMNEEETVDNVFDGVDHLDALYQLPAEWSREQRRDYHVESYKKYIGLMQSTAEFYGIRYAAFLQPSPLFFKPLTEKEKEVVTITSYGEDYEYYWQELLELQNDLPVYSLLRVFDGVEEDIYKDSIHIHQKSSGPGRVTDAIFAELDEAWFAESGLE